MKQISGRILNDNILHPESHFLSFCFSAELLSGDRWKILRATNSESLNKHKILKYSLCNDRHLWTWPIPVHEIVYLVILLHFSPIALRVRLALSSQYLFLVVAKPFAANQNVKTSVPIVLPRCPYFIMTLSNGNLFCVTGHLCGEFTAHRWIPCTKVSDAELWFFFYLRLNKQLSKQWWGWWFETPSCPLSRHCNVLPEVYQTKRQMS